MAHYEPGFLHRAGDGLTPSKRIEVKHVPRSTHYDLHYPAEAFRLGRTLNDSEIEYYVRPFVTANRAADGPLYVWKADIDTLADSPGHEGGPKLDLGLRISIEDEDLALDEARTFFDEMNAVLASALQCEPTLLHSHGELNRRS